MEQTWTIALDGGEPVTLRDLEIVRSAEQIPWSSAGHWKPDQEWEFTDAFGHTHRWVERDGEMVLPTLVETMVPCDGACGDPEHEVSEWHCAYCGSEVEPGYKHTGPLHGYLPGPSSMTIVFETAAKLFRSHEAVDIEIRRDGAPYLLGKGRMLERRIDSSGTRVEMDVLPNRELVADDR